MDKLCFFFDNTWVHITLMYHSNIFSDMQVYNLCLDKMVHFEVFIKN